MIIQEHNDGPLPRLIMINGVKTAGKGEVAKQLMKWNYTLIKFATPLKNMIRSLLRDAGIPEEEIENYIEGNMKEEPIQEIGGAPCRTLMKTLGVDWRDIISPSLYADIGYRRVSSLLSQGKSIVIDDFRFEQEYEAMKCFMPSLWLVCNEKAEKNRDTHVSEQELDRNRFNVVIENNTTLSNLHRQIDKKMEEMLSSGKRKRNISIPKIGWRYEKKDKLDKISG